MQADISKRQSPTNLLGESFIVDFDSGLIFGNALPIPEHFDSTTVISKAYKKTDYRVVSSGRDQGILLHIRASVPQPQKPFTLFDATEGTTFSGTCTFGAANNSFKPKPLRGSA